MSNFVAISGCSSGGKSTLLNELGQRGYPTIDEPGRRIVIEEQRNNGIALPWINPEAFLQRAIEVSLTDLNQQFDLNRWVFVDRGLVDACSGLAAVTGISINVYLKGKPRYHQTVFLTPPWEEIYVNDEQRKHSFAEAIKEYDRLLTTYPEAGYNIVILQKTSVSERADIVLDRLGKP